MVWLILIALALFLLVRRWKLQPVLELEKQIKCGVKSYPFIGHGHLFVGGGENRMKSLIRFGREAIKNGGTTLLWVGAHCYVVTVDPVDIEVILKTFVAKDDIMRFARSFIGNGLIFAPVPIWRARRKVAAPTFSPYKLKNFVTIFARQSSVMVDKLKSVADNEVVSVWKYVTTFTLDSVCETVLGVSINSQENSEQKLLKAFDTVCKLTAERMMQPWLQPDIVYKLLPQHFKYQKNKRIVYEFVDEIIKSVRQTLKENSEIEKSNPERIKSFLELLIESSGGENGYSDRELLEETLVMMVAGTDTSAVGSSFTIRMLADYPDVQEKVFKELQDVFSDSDRPVTTEDLVHLKYLDAVIKETLRLYPPVPVIVREIDENIKLPSGVTLKKGCGLTVHIWGTHRNPAYWGDDAEQFRPERFIETPPKHPAAFQAFSSGPRSCLGYLLRPDAHYRRGMAKDPSAHISADAHFRQLLPRSPQACRNLLKNAEKFSGMPRSAWDCHCNSLVPRSHHRHGRSRL
ncbi:unnamed protein product [Arctia plantaginis]|uniref:Cytochrome P450 n=1 Tax=Arctia plantaginis TaxID=874455 RepID=A0A8S1BK01_ARCPL|nr:unnamed protein product [Arctia plantaginis]